MSDSDFIEFLKKLGMLMFLPAGSPEFPEPDHKFTWVMISVSFLFHPAGGTPEQVLSDPELMKLFIPPLRADYVMMEGFR